MADIITNAPDQFTSVLLGVFIARPDWNRVDTAQELVFELMKVTPEGQRALMLSVIGWTEWLKGKSSFAGRYFKLALEDVEGYRFAELMTDLVSRGLLADCVRDPKKAYARKIGYFLLEAKEIAELTVKASTVSDIPDAIRAAAAATGLSAMTSRSSWTFSSTPLSLPR